MLVQVQYRFENDWLPDILETSLTNTLVCRGKSKSIYSPNSPRTVSGAVCRRFESFQARSFFLLKVLVITGALVPPSSVPFSWPRILPGSGPRHP